MSLPRRAVALAAVFTLLLVGCAPGEDPSDDEPVPAGDGHRFVQDLWVVERIATLDDGGDEIDLTERITGHLTAGLPEASFTLSESATFHRHEVLRPRVINSERVGARDDVDVDAGLIETRDGVALAIMATPVRGSDQPIFLRDSIAFDLTFLDDVLQPGDPLIIDSAFLQSLPTFEPDEAELNGAALMAHRMSHGMVQYYGSRAEPEVRLYTREIGMALAGSVFGVFPAKSQAMLEGWESGARKCLKGTRSPVKCVSDYFIEFGKGVSESWELLDEQMTFLDEEYTEIWKEVQTGRRDPEFWRTPSPERTPTPTPTPRSSDEECGVAAGTAQDSNEEPGCSDPPPGGGGLVGSDPHVLTFDGAQYSMQGVGEYVAARNDDFEVQLRTVALSDVASGVAAVAIRVGDHRVVITEPTAGDESWVRVDGSPVAAALTRVGDAVLRQERHSVSVTAPDGSFVRVQGAVPDVFTVRIEPTGTGWAGLLGDNDGDAGNDLQTRDGVTLDSAGVTAEEIHSTFSESWRISDTESLFEYAAGQSTATFTDRDYPRAQLDLANIPAEQLAMAERLCIAAGIVDDAVFDWCVFDMIVMGDLDTLASAAALGVIRNIRSIDAVVAASQGHLVRQSDGTFEDQRFAPQRIIRGARDADGAPDKPVDASSWEVTGWALLGAGQNSITCAPGGQPHAVWGGHEVYATESSVCTAAVHAGVITIADGGAVTIDPLEQGEGDQYQDAGALPGYEQNGVTSQSVWAGRAFTIRQE